MADTTPPKSTIDPATLVPGTQVRFTDPSDGPVTKNLNGDPDQVIFSEGFVEKVHEFETGDYWAVTYVPEVRQQIAVAGPNIVEATPPD